MGAWEATPSFSCESGHMRHRGHLSRQPMLVFLPDIQKGSAHTSCLTNEIYKALSFWVRGICFQSPISTYSLQNSLLLNVKDKWECIRQATSYKVSHLLRKYACFWRFHSKFFLLGVAFKPTKEVRRETRLALSGLVLLFAINVPCWDQCLEENKWNKILLKRNFQVMPNAFFFSFLEKSTGIFWLKRYNT